MGYNLGHLAQIASLVREGHLERLPSLFDLGAQDLHYADKEAAVHQTHDLADAIGAPRPDADKLFPKPSGIVPVQQIMGALGVEYLCTDIDARPNVLVLDLNSARMPPELDAVRGRFPLVTNFGNTEHIANQLYSFRLLHDLCATGGLIWCHVPMLGMMNHGFVNLTPKFWRSWVHHNDYEIVHCWVDDNGPLDRSNPNHYGDDIASFRGLPVDGVTNANMRLIARKRSDALFIPPMDFPWLSLSPDQLRGVYATAVRDLYPSAPEAAIRRTLDGLIARRTPKAA